MLQKGKYVKVSSDVDDISRDWEGGGMGQGQGSRSPHRWGEGSGAGKETFFVSFVRSSIALCFVKFLMLFVVISLLFCCLRLRIGLTPFLPFAVT